MWYCIPLYLYSHVPLNPVYTIVNKGKQMHYAVLLLTIVLTSVSIKDTKGQSNSKNSEPVTVKYVDLKKYAGTWYEIAKIPNWFRKAALRIQLQTINN